MVRAATVAAAEAAVRARQTAEVAAAIAAKAIAELAVKVDAGADLDVMTEAAAAEAVADAASTSAARTAAEAPVDAAQLTGRPRSAPKRGADGGDRADRTQAGQICTSRSIPALTSPDAGASQVIHSKIPFSLNTGPNS